MSNTYNYPAITGLEIQNFRNLGHVQIDFTKSPIVCLKGGNEAGKSSVVMAIKSIGSNLNSKKHLEYIRTGTDGWKIMAYLADGRIVYRKKIQNGKTSKQEFGVYITSNGKYELAESYNKLDDSDIPVELKNSMGFVLESETKQLLNIRTYSDSMLFVDTSDGVNFKVVNETLKISQMTTALRLAAADVKKYKEEVLKADTSISTLKKELNDIRTVDLEAVYKIKTRINNEKKLILLLEEAMSWKNKYDSCSANAGALSEVDKLQTVDERLFSVVLDAVESKRKFITISAGKEALEMVNNLNIIDTSIIDRFDDALQFRNKLNVLNNNIYAEISDCNVLDVSLFEKFNASINKLNEYRNLDELCYVYSESDPVELSEEILSKLNTANEILNNINIYEQQYLQIRQVIDNFYNNLKLMGIKYSICPTCNEIILPEDEHHD